MSTVPSTSASSSSSIITPAAAEAAAQSALQEAAQSLISGSTGNSTLDVQTIVDALVAAKTAGTTDALTTEANNDNVQIGAISEFAGELSGLQSALGPLMDGSLQAAFSATASGSGLTATTGAGAVAGSYAVDVTQVAEEQSLTSGAFTSSQAAALGTGSLTISLGSKSVSLNVTSANDNLTAISDAITNSGLGVTATVVTGSDGSHLLLTSNTTGAANTISVSVSNLANDNGLSSLGVTSTAGVVNGSNPSGGSSITSAGSLQWTQTVAAQNAQFSVGGTAATSSSNTVSTVLAGVTMTLTAASVGTTQTLTIASDVTTQTNDVQAFVTDYNNVVSLMASLSSFNANAAPGSQQGPLLGDSMLTTIQTTLGNLVSGPVTSGGITTELSAIGISLNADGTLSVDSDTLTNALQNDPATVGALFNSTNGLAQQMDAQLQGYTEPDGIMDMRISTLTADLQSVTTQSNALTAYQAELTSQYNAQFTALNSLMATTNNDSQYLTQLFGGANSSGALSGSSK